MDGDAPQNDMPPPSGRQVELRAGGARATVVEVGGGIRTLSINDRDVVYGYGLDEICPASRGALLLPWPNRIADGRYPFAGQQRQLDLTKPDEHNAMHGLTRWASWQLEPDGPARVRASHVLFPKPGYPFTMRAVVDYALAPDGLTVTTTLTNLGRAAAPVGVGVHPYLAVGASGVDAARLLVPARTRLVTDGRGIPTSMLPVDGSEFDFRDARAIGEVVLDTAYTDLDRDADGLVRVRLESDGVVTEMWADETWGFVQVFTADTLGGAAHRASVAVEPMTCAPDAFNNGWGLRVLEPGEQLSGTWGLRVAAAATV